MTNALSTTPAWTPAVVSEDGDRTVLVVDFSRPSSGRDAVDVVAAALPGSRILRVDAVASLERDPGPVDLDAMAARIADGCDRAGCSPDLVVGYCNASPLAMRVAEGPRGEPVPLVLLTPGFPGWAHVEGDLAEILTIIGAGATPPVAVPHDPDAARAYVEDRIDAAMAAAVAEMQLGEGEASVLTGELGGRYKAWIGYLISALTGDAVAITTDVAVLEMPEPWAPPRAGWPEHTLRLPLSEPRATILDSDRVVELVAQAGEELS
jgi:hypothetical protein